VEAGDRETIYSSRFIHGLDKNPSKSIQNVINKWKELILAFFVIGNNLSGRVGNGTQVRLSVDFIIGCKNTVLLPPYDLVNLHCQGLFFFF
jgi:hypothetical protein